MTTLAVLSDIHGNLPAFEAVLDDIDKHPVDEIIIAGDTILGPHSTQVLECIIDHQWPVIKGNYEINLVDGGERQYRSYRYTKEEYPIPGWLNEIVPHRLKTTVSTWPDKLSLEYGDAPAVCVVHGSPRSAWESIFPTASDVEIATMLEDIAEPVVICGHTHLPFERVAGRWQLFNPGSVGLPIDGIPAASYLLLEGNQQGWKPIFRRVPFDNTSVLRGFEANGFAEKCGVVGRLLLESFKTARPSGGFIAWKDAHHPAEPFSDPLLDEYKHTCEWWEYVHPAYRVNMNEKFHDTQPS